jgi:phospholipid/cholesterol/gamma-HCH transport system permease protein
MRSFLSSLGDFAIFSNQVTRRVFSRRYTPKSLVDQMQRIGVESLTVVNLCAFFIGLVLVLQTYYMLARFGAKAEVGRIVSAAFVREIGPVFAAIMFAGRIGTGIAAELGSMVVTEQIDAYRAFGTDPIGKLAAPRVLATFLMLPALTMIANVIGIFSGYMLAVLQLGISGDVYLQNSLRALTPLDMVSSVTKGACFGLSIGLVATYIGFRTERATDAVGLSTTKTMVTSVLSILILDLILTKFFLLLGA